jgi:hypothetical protein
MDNIKSEIQVQINEELDNILRKYIDAVQINICIYGIITRDNVTTLILFCFLSSIHYHHSLMNVSINILPYYNVCRVSN